ncbi:MAG: XamI family restriction endonuclease [Rubrivivax sp.]|nr:XamI family restriction endonuclease [Rubrivivax sp.]
MTVQRLAGVRWWSLAEIEADAAASRAEFRRRRLGEPLARYLQSFDAAQPVVKHWIGEIESLFAGRMPDAVLRAELLGTETARTALRYLGAPPISDDDLETLAEARIARAAAGDDESLRKVLSVMQSILDPRRFPWLAAGVAPTRGQRQAAELSTTVLMASQRVQTLRRGDEKSAVEGGVKGLLVGSGWTEGAPRRAAGVQKLVTDAPEPRTFYTQTNLGSDNADVIVRLDDSRLLAVECKGSNSEINSRKRLNKEAAQNARAWLGRFGSDQVIPAVALQGVFKPRYVAEVQDTPMAIFWSHRLDDLRNVLLGGGAG